VESPPQLTRLKAQAATKAMEINFAILLTEFLNILQLKKVQLKLDFCKENCCLINKTKLKTKTNMESNTFAGNSARRYRIVDAEERSCVILFNIISIFVDQKVST
jgi:hypothetical protein